MKWGLKKMFDLEGMSRLNMLALGLARSGGNERDAVSLCCDPRRWHEEFELLVLVLTGVKVRMIRTISDELVWYVFRRDNP